MIVNVENFCWIRIKHELRLIRIVTDKETAIAKGAAIAVSCTLFSGEM
jgi:hypothetical protein